VAGALLVLVHLPSVSFLQLILGRQFSALQAHFRFGFFVAAALVPDALSCGASLVADLAAGRFEPASVPLLPLVAFVVVLVSETERFRSVLPPATSLTALFERTLLSVVFLAAAFLSLLLAAAAEGFLTEAEAGCALDATFLSTDGLLACFLSGDFDEDLPAVALGFSAGAGVALLAALVGALGAGFVAVLADLAAATGALVLGATVAGAAFLDAAAGGAALGSSLALEADL